eukprot:SM000227S07451  [mRNA]  locus=s227:195203:204622:+ [translate_table: standard]
MADARGAFVTRAFQRLLRDAPARRFPALHDALKAYLGERRRRRPVPACTSLHRPAAGLQEPAGPPPPPSGAPADEDPPAVDELDALQVAAREAAASLQGQEALRAPAEGEADCDFQAVPLSPADAVSGVDGTEALDSHRHDPADGGPLSIPSPTLLAPQGTNVLAAATMAEAGHSLEGTEAELVVLPLRLAIQTKQSKLIETALDCLHKLIAYGHLEGSAGEEGGKNGVLMTALFQLICQSADHTATDNVVLQVIKVILTTVASSAFTVHGESLVLAIRTCYSIVLSSRSTVNISTAKGTLMQMIGIVYRRMEAENKEGQPHMGTARPTALESATAAPPMAAADEELRSNGDAAAGGPPPLWTDEHSPGSLEAGNSLTTTSDLETLAGDADFRGLEAALEKAINPDGNTPLSKEGVDLASLTLAQRDALVVFRTLCKMSMKDGYEELVVRTKLLSLELLLGLLEGVSDAFKDDTAFLDSVKTYLCYALLRACVTLQDQVFQLACDIFAVLLLRFREPLKAEIGVFYPLIVLRSLDSVEMLEKACLDSQMLADIFINYDCDLDSTNLFERMVHSLSRLAQGAPSLDPSSISVAQNPAVQLSLLQCLVNVLKSLAKWSKDLHRELAASQMLNNEVDSGAAGTREHKAGAIALAESSSEEDFGKAKAHKSTLEAAVAEFNMKPERGIKSLVASKLVTEEPESIANFLHTTAGLDKTMVGDYLGHHTDYHIKVMHAYVDGMSFKGLQFDAAIRTFLRGFRLPGEAQKIDRIMEKFAERYCLDNPGLFKTADTAYILAYAIIMLNTDAHNPMVWPKMSKEAFVRLNSAGNAEGTGDDGAPLEMLESIYDSIVKEEVKLKDDSDSTSAARALSKVEENRRLVMILKLGTPRRRVLADTKKESEEIVARTRAALKSGGVRRGVFHRATRRELAAPMLESVGWPLLAAFSVTMEDSDSRPRIASCMEGFRIGIYLTKHLAMDTMRYAFLTSLVRFTFLHAPKEMRGKNVEALRVLLALAEHDAGSLQDTWSAILECVSRLDYISSTPALHPTVMAAANQVSREALIASLHELAGKPTEEVYVNTIRLPSDAVVEFFTALCGVSAEELHHVPPRTFSLQKLVEISYYNITRIRMVWAQIWAVLSIHFVSAGTHGDPKIAMYAIDSLRQLGMKYFERAELAQFTFQNDILKPFVVIMRSSRNPNIRELIVQCIVQMIKSKVSSIKSGWRSVFMVFTTAASDLSEVIVEGAFENVEQVVLEHFDQVLGDCFMDCVNCLIAFANNKVSPRISLKAIALLRICEDRLAEGRIPGGGSRMLSAVDVGSNDIEVTEYFWFPMLAGLSDLTSDPRDEVRKCALEVLFDLLKERGKKFSPSFWENVFNRVLFPIFDYVRHAGKDGSRPGSADIWLRETCIHCLQLLCDLFCTFYKEVAFMLPSLLGLLLDCATRPDPGLAAISVAAMLRLMDAGGSQFSSQDWGTLLQTIRAAAEATRPVELLQAEGSAETTPSSIPERMGGLVTPLRLPHGAGLPDEVTTPQSKALVNPRDVLEPRDAMPADEAAQPDSNEAREDSTGATDEAAAQENGRLADGGDGHDNGFNGRDAENDGGTAEWGRDTDDFPASDQDRPAMPADNSQLSGLLDRSNTFGKRFMTSMMDTLLLKSISGAPKIARLPASLPPLEIGERGDESFMEEETFHVSRTVRTKCYVQLLLLQALQVMQQQHWQQLDTSHKRQLLDSAQQMVDFAATYDSDIDLRQQMAQTSSDRPPPSLLRQEVESTELYLSALFKVVEEGGRADGQPQAESLAEEAEGRLVQFCTQVLEGASRLQSLEDSTRQAERQHAMLLRAPIVVMVLVAMSSMQAPLLKKHLEVLYPHCTRLICSDQLEVRKALGRLLQSRLMAMLP